MYRPVLSTAPAAATTLVTVLEAKAQCRIEVLDTDSDTLIAGLINGAVSYLDGWTGILGRCLLTQSWRQDFDCLSRNLRLPLFPVSAITSVKYDDPSNVEQTISNTNYELLTDDLGAFARFKYAYTLPQTESYNPPSVRVVYVAGYATAADVPAAIKHAILLMVGHWYENREAVVVGAVNTASLPMAVDALLAPFRRVRF